ncbi:MAG: amphi-Trp domain-containing protein [Desulfobacterales bacterium]
MKKDKITQHQRAERQEVVGYLEDLLNSLRSGKIVVEQNGHFISLNLPETLEIEIEARQKKEKGSFSIEISWKEPEAYDEPAKIRISTEEPANPETEASEEPDQQ